MSECHSILTFFFNPRFGIIYDRYGAVQILNEKTERLWISRTLNRLETGWLLSLLPQKKKTASGIIIPDTAKEKPQQGTVVAVPEKDKDNDIHVKTGDKVLYGKYAGTEITIGDKDYLIMSQSDILAII